MTRKLCTFCGLPADTRTGNHDTYLDCLAAKDAEIARLRAMCDDCPAKRKPVTMTIGGYDTAELMKGGA